MNNNKIIIFLASFEADDDHVSLHTCDSCSSLDQMEGTNELTESEVVALVARAMGQWKLGHHVINSVFAGYSGIFILLYFL